MVSNSQRWHKNSQWLGLLSIGFFLLLLGAIWAMNSNALTDEAKAFVKSENWQQKQLTGNMTLPEPKRNFPAIYRATEQFCLVFGFFEIAILTVRFMWHDRLERKAQAVSGIGFWLSAGYFASLLAEQSIGWFAFLAGIIISIGIAITASNLVRLFK